MKKQKICIIGTGLSGLTTAIILSKLNLNIDLFCEKNKKYPEQDKRTTALSENNFQFLKEKINFKNGNYFWPCKKINLFYQNKKEYLNFFNFNGKNKNLMYIFQNKKFVQHINNEIKKSKNIKLLYKSIQEVDYKNSFVKFNNKKAYYDLIILCVGNKNIFYDNILDNRFISKDYKEFAITGTVQHNLKLNGSSQYFLEEGPLAVLPFKKNMFSLVWSISNNFYDKNFRKLIKEKLKDIFGKKEKLKILKLQSFPLYLNLKSKYFKKNTLILGQGLHTIHPIAGQGFNLILRDITKLYLIIKKNLELGLTIKNSFILKEFYDSRNPENTIIGLGNDLIHNFFKKNKLTDPIKLQLIKNINKYKIIKKVSQMISDRGFF